MRVVGGAKWWLAAGYLLSLAAAIALLYVGPLQPDPQARGFADLPVGSPRPTRAGWLSQALIPTSPDPVVYLASIGGVPEPVLEELAGYITEKHGIVVHILLPSPPEESALDPERGQYVTEQLLATLERRFPKTAPEDRSVVIGMLTEDVYIRDRTDWAWAFGMRGDNGYAVFSTARMGSLAGPIEPIVMSRVRKMVLRDIGVLYYGLPLNDDPLSVLYSNVLGVDDLDRMIEEFCGSDCPSRASAGGVASLP